MMRKPTIALMLAGDVMTGRGIDQVQKHPGDPALHERFARDERQYVRLAEGLNGSLGTHRSGAATGASCQRHVAARRARRSLIRQVRLRHAGMQDAVGARRAGLCFG